MTIAGAWPPCPGLPAFGKYTDAVWFRLKKWCAWTSITFAARRFYSISKFYFLRFQQCYQSEVLNERGSQGHRVKCEPRKQITSGDRHHRMWLLGNELCAYL